MNNLYGGYKTCALGRVFKVLCTLLSTESVGNPELWISLSVMGMKPSVNKVTSLNVKRQKLTILRLLTAMAAVKKVSEFFDAAGCFIRQLFK